MPAGIIAARRLQLTCAGATSLLQLGGHVRMIFTLKRSALKEAADRRERELEKLREFGKNKGERESRK